MLKCKTPTTNPSAFDFNFSIDLAWIDTLHLSASPAVSNSSTLIVAAQFSSDLRNAAMRHARGAGICANTLRNASAHMIACTL
jgi:hypothetical protein